MMMAISKSALVNVGREMMKMMTLLTMNISRSSTSLH